MVILLICDGRHNARKGLFLLHTIKDDDIPPVSCLMCTLAIFFWDKGGKTITLSFTSAFTLLFVSCFRIQGNANHTHIHDRIRGIYLKSKTHISSSELDCSLWCSRDLANTLSLSHEPTCLSAIKDGGHLPSLVRIYGAS